MNLRKPVPKTLMLAAATALAGTLAAPAQAQHTGSEVMHQLQSEQAGIDARQRELTRKRRAFWDRTGNEFAMEQAEIDAMQAEVTRKRRRMWDEARNASAQFDFADRNADGFVTRDEATQIPGKIRAFARADGNDDGKLSREEWRQVALGNVDVRRRQ